MSQTSIYLVSCTVAYLLGAIPFGYILVKVFLKQDIRATGSGNIGATNVARSGRRGLAIATLLLDAGKGLAAVYFAGWLAQHNAPGEPLAISPAAIAALCAIAGHVFPIWLRFRGGKGVATGVGSFAALAPKAVLIAFAVFLLVLIAFRYVSLGSILAAIIFPICAYLVNPSLSGGGELAIMFAASLLIIAKHHANIRRILAGNEHRFGVKQA